MGDERGCDAWMSVLPGLLAQELSHPWHLLAQTVPLHAEQGYFVRSDDGDLSVHDQYVVAFCPTFDVPWGQQSLKTSSA